MATIRTPAKSKTDNDRSPRLSPETAKAGLSPNAAATSKVRRSIGEWEAGLSEPRPCTSKTHPHTPEQPEQGKAPAPSRTVKQKAASPRQLKELPTRRPSADTAEEVQMPAPKKRGPTGRMAEARDWLVYAKFNVNKSRNMKTDLKAGAILAVDNLYRLIKEYAEELTRKTTGAKTPAAAATTPPETKSVGVNTEEIGLNEGRMGNDVDEGRRDMGTKDIVELLKVQGETINKTYLELEKLRQGLEAEKTAPISYAEAAATTSGRPGAIRPALHSVIITSKDEKETGDEVLDRVRKSVNAKDGWVTVERVRKVKDRRVVIGCKTEEARRRVKERLKGAEDHLTVEEIKNHDPMVVLKDVLKMNSDEDIMAAFKNQNGEVLKGLNGEDAKFDIKYRRKARNQHCDHVVLRVSPRLYNNLVGRGYVHIDMQRVRVEDQSPLVQCSMCLGYGHGRKFCRESVPKCSHCGGPHMKQDCADWMAGDSPRCCNCTAAKFSENLEHNAFSPECSANLQRCSQATDELMMEAAKGKLAFALVQEPYTGATRILKTYRGTRVVQSAVSGGGTVKAAIVLFDDSIDLTLCPTLTTENIAVAKLRTAAWEILVVSVYLQGDGDIEADIGSIRDILERTGGRSTVLGGDVNSWSIWWGSVDTNRRGETLGAALDEMGLHILNRGTEPTYDYHRGGRRYTSCVDITTCTEDLLDRVDNWRLNADMTVSDHRAILFEIKLEKSKGIDVKRTTRKFNTRKANWVELREELTLIWERDRINREEIGSVTTKEELDKKIEQYTKGIDEACEKHIPKIKEGKRKGLPWWTEQLSEKKAEVKRLRRRIAGAAQERREVVLQEYLQAKNEYTRLVKNTKTESWKSFCGKQERESMWDGIYRVIGRTTNRQEDTPLIRDGRVMEGDGSAKLLSETFYPKDDIHEDNEAHKALRLRAETVNEGEDDDSSDPPFTMEELRWAVESFNPKKAPGVDGLTADICRVAINHDPKLFLEFANKCLSVYHFPTIWKEAVVVILPKPGKENYTTPKSYRPIGLLPVLGKIFEKMLVRRIRWHTADHLCKTQYGFTPQRSTEDSLYDMMTHIKSGLKRKKIMVMVSLDIEGAFDSAWWPAIRCRLEELKCPKNIRKVVDSYLTDRMVRVRYAGAEHAVETTKGCVQGSIGGPTFWNILLDPLLKGLGNRGDYCQAFADDVVLVFSGETAQEVQRQANAALAYVWDWGVANKLKFAPHKTNAMVITNKLKHDTPILSMGGGDIALSKEIKLLGLTIDEKLTFNSHVANVCRKALNIYKQLARAAKVEWGLSSEIIRTIYVAVIEPIIMYASSAWSPAASKLGIRKHLNEVQRGFAQKMVKAYRTTSLNSALVLSGLLPLDLRIREAASLYEIKKGYSRRVVEDRAVEVPIPYARAPHPAKIAYLEFGMVENSADLIQRVNDGPQVFTDGSKIEGKVGAALSLWNDGAEITVKKLKLEEFCTVFQAELLAITKATAIIKAHRTGGIFSIYSDSRSALETITRGVSLHPLVIETRKNIQEAAENGKTIKLFWIKAHAGMEGNERADELAKEAALRLKKKPDYDECPISFVKRILRQDTIGEWEKRYQTEQTAKTTKLFLPSAAQAYRMIRSVQPYGKLTQILTGHGGFAQYLNRFKCRESPSCACDDLVEETVPHLLVECPIFERLRFDLEQAIDYSPPSDTKR
ncbi:uncharacterized protein LOC135076627 [Ostrinia nubilalis]|uniref:uncharacterized protein LOC135076627 n=1 Tax=Ostrinia nubilalis TaxID=29057 RepID=UPI0030823732